MRHASPAADGRRLSDARARQAAADTALAGALGIAPDQAAALTVSWPTFAEPEAGINADAPLSAYQDNQEFLARPDVLRAVAAYDQAEAGLRVEVARQWPEIHLGPGYTWERGLVKLPFSLGLVLPPRDLNRSAIAAAEARRLEAGVHLDAVVSEGQSALSAARSEYAAASAALRQVRSVELPAARAAARTADAEIRLGAIDRVDWAAAQVLLHGAELNEIDALRRAHAGIAALEDALRRPVEGPEQALSRTIAWTEPPETAESTP